MNPTMTRTESPRGAAGRTGESSEAVKHSEGPVARSIEEYTAQLPSDTFLWAAGASIAGSLTLMATGNRHGALFVGQWAPTFLLLGIYNKIVKVAGSDRVHKS
ncbi:Uncharacterized protein OS=Rhodopirellula maiorica SM1 GN=RMSM_00090 PE=4 SV=1 [Gemmataceae bacterium]|nr:Uncharacterized protein OS=Rhodopirellula maiorica SM1 GN=RMSM_00090 PE=4 SV=1 [Gemmataceae bacterium]VTT98645.1 Uncharacterized protein OS=Rhodopirellula maiorica SM1 GN=RMSM_00090 PE=4 SV=1 [Gemmataceae bacterium]